MVLLAIDTATKSVGLALHSGSELLSEHVWISKGFHTVELAPEIALMLRKADRTVADLTAVAVAQGPGSYTGLRIGMALAKGLALAHNLRLIGVPTLDIIARGHPPSNSLLFTVIQAGRKRISAGWYELGPDGWQVLREPENMIWEDFIVQLEEETIVCGEVGDIGRGKLEEVELVELALPAQSVRRPGILAELGWEKLRLGEIDDPGSLAPVYLQTGSSGKT